MTGSKVRTNSVVHLNTTEAHAACRGIASQATTTPDKEFRAVLSAFKLNRSECEAEQLVAKSSWTYPTPISEPPHRHRRSHRLCRSLTYTTTWVAPPEPPPPPPATDPGPSAGGKHGRDDPFIAAFLGSCFCCISHLDTQTTDIQYQNTNEVCKITTNRMCSSQYPFALTSLPTGLRQSGKRQMRSVGVVDGCGYCRCG